MNLTLPVYTMVCVPTNIHSTFTLHDSTNIYIYIFVYINIIETVLFNYDLDVDFINGHWVWSYP